MQATVFLKPGSLNLLGDIMPKCYWATRIAAALLIAAATLSMPASATYIQTNLVSGTSDLDLVNPWGLVASSTSPFWVSDNGSGLATLYNGSGTKQGLVVTIPPGGTATPTGVVFSRP